MEYDVVAKLTGKTIEPFLFRNFNAVVRRRQALERFMLDGDMDALMRTVGEVTF